MTWHWSRDKLLKLHISTFTRLMVSKLGRVLTSRGRFKTQTRNSWPTSCWTFVQFCYSLSWVVFISFSSFVPSLNILKTLRLKIFSCRVSVLQKIVMKALRRSFFLWKWLTAWQLTIFLKSSTIGIQAFMTFY